jgi:hypothetical protein
MKKEGDISLPLHVYIVALFNARSQLQRKSNTQNFGENDLHGNKARRLWRGAVKTLLLAQRRAVQPPR